MQLANTDGGGFWDTIQSGAATVWGDLPDYMAQYLQYRQLRMQQDAARRAGQPYPQIPPDLEPQPQPPAQQWPAWLVPAALGAVALVLVLSRR